MSKIRWFANLGFQTILAAPESVKADHEADAIIENLVITKNRYGRTGAKLTQTQLDTIISKSLAMQMAFFESFSWSEKPRR